MTREELMIALDRIILLGHSGATAEIATAARREIDALEEQVEELEFDLRLLRDVPDFDGHEDEDAA